MDRIVEDINAVLRNHGIAGASAYGREKEYRLICKTWKEIGPQPIGTGPSSYVEIGYKLDVLEVCANSRPSNLGAYPSNRRGL